MSVIEDLNLSVTTLQATTESVLLKLDELKNQPNNDAAISAASSAINEAVNKLNGAIS